MFHSLSNGWEYAKLSYGILWEKKSLILFPIFSTVAAALVLASFYLPLAGNGTLAEWQAFVDQNGEGTPVMYATLFAFYFANYFVIVFFNSALVYSSLEVLEGRDTSVGSGLGAALARLPQILAWSFLSAVVGVILKSIERHEKVGAIVSAILGTAWTVLTYFAVPVIVVEGHGPLEAFKRSAKIMKDEWGTALVGNFSLGCAGIVYLLPLFLAGMALGYVGVQMDPTGAGLPFMLGSVVAFVAMFATSSAADVVFKAVLYQYSTGKRLPAHMDKRSLGSAFTRS